MSKVLGLIVTVDESEMTALDLKKQTKFTNKFSTLNSVQCLYELFKELDKRVSSPGRSGGGAEKRRRACNYVSGI